MNLAFLLEHALGIQRNLNANVTGIAQDTRLIQKGFVFVARSGLKVDGHGFAEEAVKKGAIAIVGEKAETRLFGVPYIQVENAKRAIAKLAATFHRHPNQAFTTFGITGTDGKTTTSFMLHHLLAQHYKTALLSTAATKIASKKLELEGHFTTPEAPEIQALLAQFRDASCSHLVLEASSHGFAQHRLDEISFDVGIFTNLTPEHLDFHETFEAYREAKLELCRRSNMTILNRDDANYHFFADASRASLSYGFSDKADWQAKYPKAIASRQLFSLYVKQFGQEERFEVMLPMVGDYNIHNALAAMAAAHQAGLSIPEIIRHLASFEGVPGRMQSVQNEPFKVIVDFAHTPASLEKVLTTLRPITTGKLIVVIGAAGERDPVKRPQLGQLSQTHADIGIFTEEDSRSESIITILIDMANGAIHAGGNATKTYWTIPDRYKAIKLALHLAQAGDTVLLAGKGHENTLERSHETLPWNEVEVAKNLLEELKEKQLN